MKCPHCKKKIKEETPAKLSVGMRARFKTDEAQNHSWREYAGQDVLLHERSSDGDFSVIVLGKGIEELETEKAGVVVNQVAWVSESELDFINSDYQTNMEFIDWYSEHEYDFCGDCFAWFPDRGRTDPKTGKDHVCPNENCPGRLYDEGKCPYCKIKVEDGENCPECGFDFGLY